MDPVISNVNQALDTLYSSTDTTLKDQANDFLLKFQRSEEAWSVLFPVLGNNISDNSNSMVQLKTFMAQTFRSKVKYDFHQIPSDQLPSLKDSLIQLIVAYNDTKPKLIATQLCLALSSFALQYLEWTSALTEIIQLLSKENALSSLLEFLVILPEETSDVKQSNLSDEDFHRRTKELIYDNLQQILYLLTSFAQARSTNSNDFNKLTMSAIKSWIQDIPFQEILTNTELSGLIFENIKNDSDSNSDNFEMAIECLSTIIYETGEIEDINIIGGLYHQLLELKPILARSVDDIEKMDRLIMLYVTAGESWCPIIAKNPVFFKPLVEIILELTAFGEDLDLVRYTFKFWFDLKQLIILNTREEARGIFQPLYSKLLEIILDHLRYPLISNSTDLSDLFEHDKESEDKFKEFRYELGDVLKDCCSVVGTINAINVPFVKLQSFMNKAIANEAVQWQEIEAPLFAIRLMGKQVKTTENKIVPDIMNYIIQLPENPKIRYAATLVLGRYTEWTSKHPEFLEGQLNYIINGFTQKEGYTVKDMDDIVMAASHALKYFCVDCSGLLANFLEQLFNFYNNVADSLDIESLYDVTEGIAHVLKEEKDESKLYNITLMFWTPTLNKLNEILEQNIRTPEIDTKIADTIEIITIYTTILRPASQMGSNSPISKLLIEVVFPLVGKLISNYGKSTKVSERCAKFIKRSIENFSFSLLSILPQITELLMTGFVNYRYGCYLWVSGVFIKEYASLEWDLSESNTLGIDLKGLSNTIESFTQQQVTAFIKIFEGEVKLSDIINDDPKKPNSKIQEYADIIEDFYRMLSDVIMFKTDFMIRSGIFENSIFGLSITLLGSLSEYEALKATLVFLIDYYSWGFETPPVSMVDHIDDELRYKIMNFNMISGNQLIHVLIYGLLFRFSSDLYPETSELITKAINLSALSKDANGSPSASLTWLDQTLVSLGNSVNNQERKKLLSTIEVAINSKDYRRVRSSIRDFINWYRRKNVSRAESQYDY